MLRGFCQPDESESMSTFLLTGPLAEPLALSDAKQFLRVEHDDDDAIIAGLIASARSQVEALTRLGLLTQTWRVVLDRWPEEGRVRLRLGPLRALVAARIHGGSGAATMLDPQHFVVDAAANSIAARGLPPIPGRRVAGIELDVEVGFGADPADVPPVLLQAIRMLVAHWYENRSLIAIGQSVAMMPLSVNAMISSYRVRSL